MVVNACEPAWRSGPRAKLVEFPGSDHLPGIDAMRFSTKSRSSSRGAPRSDPDRIPATILFTDIAG
jgi:hypothetical protein